MISVQVKEQVKQWTQKTTKKGKLHMSRRGYNTSCTVFPRSMTELLPEP